MNSNSLVYKAPLCGAERRFLEDTFGFWPLAGTRVQMQISAFDGVMYEPQGAAQRRWTSIIVHIDVLRPGFRCFGELFQNFLTAGRRTVVLKRKAPTAEYEFSALRGAALRRRHRLLYVSTPRERLLVQISLSFYFHSACIPDMVFGLLFTGFGRRQAYSSLKGQCTVVVLGLLFSRPRGAAKRRGTSITIYIAVPRARIWCVFLLRWNVLTAFFGLSSDFFSKGFNFWLPAATGRPQRPHVVCDCAMEASGVRGAISFHIHFSFHIMSFSRKYNSHRRNRYPPLARV
ncbi:hypothetical protein B0H16DRAFT_413336 [Mycena metata]|uniref:Uncharacterized protein n=1 Tax=Mycena metata TaxID=1033252 RepID=A0AAD7HF66_9AGAR|nr:hypothetical protein B0H16DRAFT_413336 [Mycena metata]